MLSTNTVPQRHPHVQRFARVFGKLIAKRAFVCPWCSVLREGKGPGTFGGPLCLLHEPEGTSHHICPDCARLFLSDALRLEAWAALRRGHLKLMRSQRTAGEGTPDDAA